MEWKEAIKCKSVIFDFSWIYHYSNLRTNSLGSLRSGREKGEFYLLLGILRGGSVPPVFPNPDPVSDQKGHFVHPFSDLYIGRNFVIVT